jgi:hypothetical protein
MIFSCYMYIYAYVIIRYYRLKLLSPVCIYSLFHVLFSLFGRLFYIFFDFTVCNSKIEKKKINVQIKKIEHGIANIFYFFRFYYVHAVLTTTNTEVGVKEHQKKRDNTTSTYIKMVSTQETF